MKSLKTFVCHNPIWASIAAAAFFTSPLATGAVTALDNTNNLSTSLVVNLGSLTATNWNLKVFTLGASDATISSMVMGMYSTLVRSYNLTWEIYAVDASNTPIGSALASDTQSVSFATASSPGYLTFNTGGTLGSYSMTAGGKYGLLFKSDATSTTLSWTEVPGTVIYSPGTSGFTYVANRRTTNSGASYGGNNTYYNAWQMNVDVASAVPEPASALGTAGLLSGCLLLRRRGRI